MSIEEMAAEARAIMAEWPKHREHCTAFYCQFESCEFVERLEEREVALLESLAAYKT